MHFIKIFVFIGLSLAIGFLGCAERKVEAPTQRANHEEFGSTEG